MTVWGVDPGLRGTAARRVGDRVVVCHVVAMSPESGDVVYIERPLSVTGQSRRGNETQWMRYGALVDRIRRAGARVVEVHPRTWQAALRLTAGRGETKTAHKARMARALIRSFGGAVDGADERDCDALGLLLYGLHREGIGAVEVAR